MLEHIRLGLVCLGVLIAGCVVIYLIFRLASAAVMKSIQDFMKQQSERDKNEEKK